MNSYTNTKIFISTHILVKYIPSIRKITNSYNCKYTLV